MPKHAKIAEAPTLNIRALRQTQGWSMEELAQRAKLAKTTIYNLESKSNKRIDLETLEKLCSVFDCTPNDILNVRLANTDQLVRSQKAALASLIGIMHYDIPVNPKTLDQELANITHLKMNYPSA